MTFLRQAGRKKKKIMKIEKSAKKHFGFMHNIPSLQGRVLNLDLEHYFDDTKRAHGKELGKRKNEDSIF